MRPLRFGAAEVFVHGPMNRRAETTESVVFHPLHRLLRFGACAHEHEGHLHELVEGLGLGGGGSGGGCGGGSGSGCGGSGDDGGGSGDGGDGGHGSDGDGDSDDGSGVG